MADSVSTSLPNILWRIENYGNCKKMVRTLSFLGLRWKLIFNLILNNGEKMIMFRLECLNIPKNLQNLKLCSYACIFPPLLRKEHLQVKTEIKMEDEEWCVWMHPLTSVQPHTVGFPHFSFSIRIIPEEVTKEKITFVEQIRKQAEEEKKGTCASILIKDFTKLYNTREHSDFEIRCKEWRSPVHKAVLSARCDYFAALFRSDMKEADKGYVEFHDIEPETLQHVIHYLYSGKLPELPGDSLREVYAVADRFDIESLRVKCSSLVLTDFLNESQTKTETDTSEQDKENIHVPCDDKRHELLKQLFRSFEWEILSENDPALAEMICKPLFFDIL